MIILKIIHGYPMRYNAGSEVYTQQLCHGLSENHEVHVFTREEDVFKPDYVIHTEQDTLNPRITLHIANMPKLRLLQRYQHDELDRGFEQLLDRLNPHVVHIGHLNHLSTALVDFVHERRIPIVFTLHDYWLMCPRGQFLQRNSKEPWALCDGQQNKKCAESCFAGFFSGSGESETDVAYWTHWVAHRMSVMKGLVDKVDQFIAPSQYLLARFRDEFCIPEKKLVYLDYGFDLDRLENRHRSPDEPFTFGYIGTHIPAKGIQDLLRAFALLEGNCLLRIWGRFREETVSLKSIVSTFPAHVQDRIEWKPEYRNQEIVSDVFNHIDALVVPSIWVENSPLVIHEALQVQVPVITANVGGMAEYVHHEVNGLLFQHRNYLSLSEQMQKLVVNPAYAKKLGAQGYMQTKSKSIPNMKQHVKDIEQIYTNLKPGPWRITFDTNPDQCNYKCVMCECFSPHSDVQKKRIESKTPRRRMDIQLIRKVLEQAQGTPLREIIPSTMGEPLLYSDFDEIIELCREFNVKLNLTTNGSFPRKGAEAWAKLLVPITSDIKVSWNGATKETQEAIMIGAHWEKSLENLKTLIRIRDEHAKSGGNRCRITLQTTFLENSAHELPDLIKLGVELGVDRIKGHHLWAHFTEIKGLSMRRNRNSIERWNEIVRQAKEIAQDKIILEHFEELELGAVDDLVPGGVCPFLGNEAWVNAEGKFSPCCAPDELRKTLGEFGNLNDTTMEDIWTGEPYNHLKQTYQSHALCIGCNMKKAPVEAAQCSPN